MPNHETDRITQHLNQTSPVETQITCRRAAKLLQLEGGAGCHCPRCLTSIRKEPPRMVVGEHFFECLGCGRKGDVVELVEFARHCTREEALDWLRHKSRPRRPVLTDETISMVNQAFIEACRPVPRYVQQLLLRWSISSRIVQKFNLRYYTHDYPIVLMRLAERFGVAALKAAGLVADLDESAPLSAKVLAERSCFAKFADARVPYLILPYMEDGRVISLKARALTDHQRLEEMNLPTTLTTLTPAPSFYNEQAVRGAQQVLLFRRELDVLVAASMGLHAVACSSWSHFSQKDAAIFKGKRTFIVLDESSSDLPLISTREAFGRAKLPMPTVLRLPEHEDLAKFLHRRINSNQDVLSMPASDSAAAATPQQQPLIDQHARHDHRGSVIRTSENRMLRIQNVRRHGRAMVRVTAWQRSDGDHNWKREEGQGLVVPAEQLNQMISALRRQT